MTSEYCFRFRGCVFFIFDVQNPWYVTTLDRMISGGLDCCGDYAKGIASYEFVECGEVQICVGGP